MVRDCENERVLNIPGERISPNTVRLTAPILAWVHLRVTDPLVAWLTYRGVLESVSRAAPEFLSLWSLKAAHSALLDDKWFFIREAQIEAARAARNPDAVSRLRGIFAFPNKETADRAVSAWGGFESYFLQEIEIREGSVVSWFDSHWIDSMGNTSAPTSDAAESYSLGTEFGSQPLWELLIDGKADLVGIELREKAYNVVRAQWPDALSPLEIARLGAQLDSSIGYIAAFPRLAEDEVVIEFMMDFQDATNPTFLEALREYLAALPPEHINRADLAVGGEFFGVPDLRSRSLTVPMTSWPGRTAPEPEPGVSSNTALPNEPDVSDNPQD